MGVGLGFGNYMRPSRQFKENFTAIGFFLVSLAVVILVIVVILAS